MRNIRVSIGIVLHVYLYTTKQAKLSKIKMLQTKEKTELRLDT